MSTHRNEIRGVLVLVLLITVLTATYNTIAVFSDRVSHQMQIRTAAFTGDGYTLERSAAAGPFIAGEDVTFSLKETNSNSVDISSMITMTTRWESPDTTSSLFDNNASADNVVITIGNETVTYTSNGDGSATFIMPKHVIAGGSDCETELTLHVPSSLKSTGELQISFDKVVIEQYPDGISKEHSREDLNAEETLDFTTPVGWAASASSAQNGKSLMAYLTGEPGKYGVKFETAFDYKSSAMKDFTSADQSDWRLYKNEVKSVTFCNGMTSIGDYAFSNFTGVTAVTLPDSVKSIGTSAFYGSGLSGEVTIPKSVTTIESLAFGSLTKVNTFTFEHAVNTAVSLPNNESSGKESSGAFYMGSPYSITNPLSTTVNASNADILEYSWQNDNRGYIITRETAAGVSISIDRDIAVKGQKVTIKPETAAGYTYSGSVISWTERGVKKSLTLSANELIFTMPNSAISIAPSAVCTVELPSPNVLVYNGNEQSPVWSNYDSSTLTIGGVYSATNAGTYEATFTPKANCQWADGTTTAKTVSWRIEKATVTVPSLSGTLTYTGSVQSPSWNNYDSTKMTIGGTTSAANVGSYEATFTPKENYQWADGTTTAQAVDWTIGKAILTVPSQNGTLTYTGSAQSPSWNGYDSSKMTIGGTTTGTNAGTYGATFTLKDTNYQWADGTTTVKNVDWTIGRASLSVPSQSGTVTYTGRVQSPSWYNYQSTKMTIGGTTSSTNASTYYATFTPKENYQWTDGTTAAKSVAWKIGRATLTVPSPKETLSYTGSSQSPSWNNYDSSKMTIGGTTSATNAGTYYATFTPKANYQWSGGSTSAKSVAWKIEKTTYTVTIVDSVASQYVDNCYIQYGSKKYTSETSFEVNAGDTLTGYLKSVIQYYVTTKTFTINVREGGPTGSIVNMYSSTTSGKTISIPVNKNLWIEFVNAQ